MEQEINWLIGLDSIDKSIIKWKKILYDHGEDQGIWNCDLCSEYNEDRCYNCPIKQKEGYRWCVNTPYTAWYAYHEEILFTDIEDKPLTVQDKESAIIANEELSYLYSVRLWWIIQKHKGEYNG